MTSAGLLVRVVLLVFLALVPPSVFLAFHTEPPTASTESESEKSEPGNWPDGPRLAVLVVFDQMRGDYPDRWQKLYEQDGFERLRREAAWFSNCHYPYAHTVTGAGHASILTGCSPNRHGIVGNGWYDTKLGMEVYCVGSDRDASDYSKTGRVRSHGSESPERILVPSLGDSLKKATAGKGRIFSLSFKDRSAILPGGKKANACYWIDDETGMVITSSYYRDSVHPWVAQLNRERICDRWQGKTWDRLKPELDYAKHLDLPPNLTPERMPARIFPHALRSGKNYYKDLYGSPFGNELILELAKRAVESERLGQRGVPDLLCISFSCNDPIGHKYGPDSPEVLDVTLRSDLIIRDLLAFLDEKVGRGQYVLALTADHGICPLPEVSQARGLDAGRMSDVLNRQLEMFLTTTYNADGKDRFLRYGYYPWAYFNHETLAKYKLDEDQVAATTAEWLEKHSSIQKAYTRRQLSKEPPADDVLGWRMYRSNHPERCGDVTVVPTPYYVPMSPFTSGTTHGSPHPYDTHVPLIIYGPGIEPGRRTEPVTPQAIAAIFAKYLGVPPPSAAEADVPTSLAP